MRKPLFKLLMPILLLKMNEFGNKKLLTRILFKNCFYFHSISQLE